MLLAIDSFKESMTSLQAAKAFEQGIRTVLPQISIATLLVSDGGEGFTEAFLHTGKGHRVRTMVTGPLGKRIMAHFGIFDRGKQAVVELAQASGLALLKPGERNPMRTSSYGTGELINAAIQQGVRTITVGIGGSATNDGGIGMAQALGAIFYNAQGDLIAAPATGKDLLSIARIDLSGVRRRLSGVRIAVACDVANPMTGPRGSSAVYGPQKGATPAMVRHLDAGLRNLCRVIRKDVGKNIERMPGAGAAGADPAQGQHRRRLQPNFHTPRRVNAVFRARAPRNPLKCRGVTPGISKVVTNQRGPGCRRHRRRARGA